MNMISVDNGGVLGVSGTDLPHCRVSLTLCLHPRYSFPEQLFAGEKAHSEF